MKITTLVALVSIFAQAPVQASEPEPIRLAFDTPGWELSGEDSVVEPFDGRLALRLRSGNAVYRDLDFLDGTIEFEMQLTELRSFAYLYFRMETDDEHEEIYFRPHKSRLPDAIQYAPVYSGRSQWQLYHDGRSTAAARLPAGEWIPVRLVVAGSQAAVFVGGSQEPQLVVPRLARPSTSGFIALRSFMTSGTPPGTFVANFANVVVRPGVVDYAFAPAETATPVAGRISKWQISKAFVPAEGAVQELPESWTAGGWKTIEVNRDGFVELERHVERPEGGRRSSVLARLRIDSEKGETRRLDLGFSDEISVFLNGRLLVAADDSYSFNAPRRQGLLTDRQLSVFLPLVEGENEIVLAVTDSFGGWGLSGTLEKLEAGDGE